MTAQELRDHFSSYGLNPWPKTFEVDAETYANCCQSVFEHLELTVLFPDAKFDIYSISLGKSKGLMFKNVELIYKQTKVEESSDH